MCEEVIKSRGPYSTSHFLLLSFTYFLVHVNEIEYEFSNTNHYFLIDIIIISINISSYFIILFVLRFACFFWIMDYCLLTEELIWKIIRWLIKALYYCCNVCTVAQVIWMHSIWILIFRVSFHLAVPLV